MKGNFAAIVLILIGAGFLLSNLGLLNFSVIEVLPADKSASPDSSPAASAQW